MHFPSGNSGTNGLPNSRKAESAEQKSRSDNHQCAHRNGEDNPEEEMVQKPFRLGASLRREVQEIRGRHSAIGGAQQFG